VSDCPTCGHPREIDPLERIARLVIDAYHTTRMAEVPAEVHVANSIRARLANEGIHIIIGKVEAA
jgi:hypothetical protein